MSDDAPIAVDNSSVSIDMPNHAPVETSTAPNLADIIPADYADKPWVGDVKDINGLFKMADDLKSQMGKRPAGIPQADASTEEWNTFNKALGVPESVDGYEIDAPLEGMEDYQKGMGDLYLKLGLTPRQAQGLNEGNMDLLKDMTPDQDAQDAEFEKMTADHFGNRKEEAIQITEALLVENSKDLPEGLKDAFNGLPNKQLMAITAILDKFQSKYINSDDLPSTASSATTAVSAEERRQEGVAIMSSPEFQNKSHPGHAAAKAKVDAIYASF